MRPGFERCFADLEASQYEPCLTAFPQLLAEAQAPEELLLVARLAGIALLPGLETRLIRRAQKAPACPPAGTLIWALHRLADSQWLLAEETLAPGLASPNWSDSDRVIGYAYMAQSLAARRRFASAAEWLQRAEALADLAGREARRRSSTSCCCLRAGQHGAPGDGATEPSCGSGWCCGSWGS